MFNIMYRYAYTRQSYTSYRVVYYNSNECCSGYALVNGGCTRKQTYIIVGFRAIKASRHKTIRHKAIKIINFCYFGL